MSNQLSIPFKRTSPATIRKSVRDYIQDNLPDTHPEAFKWDVERWEQLRRDAMEESVHVSRVQAIIKYCAQLTFVLTKIPVDIGLVFSYSAALKPSETSVDLSNIAYERAALLFNLAALYSKLALAEDRSHAEGIKRANAFYQKAAGTLSFLISSALPPLAQSLNGEVRIDELSDSFLRGLEYLMLAQAQECAWQMAVMDRFKNSIVARLAAKIAAFYRLSSSTVRESIPGGAFPSEWLAHIDAKHHHFESAAQYRKSMDDLESNKYGHELARLMEAKTLAKRAYEIARRDYVARPVVEDVKSLLDAIEKNIVRAERDNDLIYHQVVPPISAIPSIQDHSMVESVVPTGLQDPKSALSGDDVIFSDLASWGAKVAVEIYQDRVHNWLQEEIFNRVAELDGFADRMLQELSLPASLEALDKPVGLPPSLLKKAEEVRLEDGPARIDASIEDAEHLADRCREILDEAMDILDQEASEDEGVRKNAARHGRRWNRTPSYEANVGLTEKERRYRQMLDQAAEADEIVRIKWEQWEEAITRLTWDEKDLERWVPSSTLASASKKKDPSYAQTQSHARILRGHLESLDDLRTSRAQLVQRARRLADSDDIQPRIMREAAAIERWTEIEPAMFENTLDSEMNKYEKFKDAVEGSADKQIELSELIRNRHDQFIRSRQDDPSIKEREHALQSLDLAFHKYREIIRNLEEGLKFYNDLLNILAQFREACKEWVRYRRDEMRTLSLHVEALRIDDDNLLTPKASSGTLHASGVSQIKGKGPALDLPPPDSDEWETTPVPANRPAAMSGQSRVDSRYRPQ